MINGCPEIVVGCGLIPSIPFLKDVKIASRYEIVSAFGSKPNLNYVALEVYPSKIVNGSTDVYLYYHGG